MPAWLQLEWESPLTVHEVQLIFDTGLHRHLTLSHHDGYTGRMQWGQPQAETVCEYTIEVSIGNRWETIVEVTANYQRRRRHRLRVGHPVQTMRVNVTQTNGLDHARIAEVRVYGDDSTWEEI